MKTASEPAASASQRAGDVSSRVFEGAIWTALRNALQTGMSLLCIAVVARALGPEAYGVFGAAMLLVTSAEILSGGAYAESLVQRERLEPGHIDATFWLSMGAALVIAGAVMLGAGPLTALIGVPQARELMMVLALLIPLSSATVVPLALLARDMRFGALARIGAVASVLSSATGIALAWAGFGIWTLFFMELVRLSVNLIGGWWSVSWRPGRHGRLRHLRELARFNRDTMAMYAAGYADQLLPRALIASLLGPQVLGLYLLAMRVFDELANLVTYPLATVAMPGCARLQSDRQALHRLIIGLYRSARLIAFPAFIGLAILAPYFIAPVFGARWTDAIPAVQILMLGGLWLATAGFATSILRGVGRSGLPILLFLSGCLLQALLVPAFAHWGVIGMALAALGRMLGNWPLLCWLIRHATGLSIRQQLGGGAGVAAATATMALFVWSLAQLLEPWMAWPLLVALMVPAGAAMYVATLRILSPATVRAAVGLLRALVRRDRAAIERQLAGD
ncbi:MAG TPA: lipopolysaccharide biosynthesis protein [Burkholderiaceae bacterium]|nr:lipopolysaccharide biosynthesis protein [Burkholderiaceae bacterium]